MRWEIDELLKLFRINLDPSSSAYRELGLEVLKRFVKALQAIERRQKGEVVETPELIEASEVASPLSGVSARRMRAGRNQETHRGRRCASSPMPSTVLSSCTVICRWLKSREDTSFTSARRCRIFPFVVPASCVTHRCPSWSNGRSTIQGAAGVQRYGQ